MAPCGQWPIHTPKPVTEKVAYEPRLAVYYPKGTFRAIRDTEAATVTFFFIYFDYFTFSHRKHTPTFIYTIMIAWAV
jgi:hypothetical protein